MKSFVAILLLAFVAISLAADEEASKSKRDVVTSSPLTYGTVGSPLTTYASPYGYASPISHTGYPYHYPYNYYPYQHGSPISYTGYPYNYPYNYNVLRYPYNYNTYPNYYNNPHVHA